MSRWLHPLVASFLLCASAAGSSHAAQGDCGQPATDGDKPRSTDALFILRTSVNLEACDLCICDIDASGATRASDALVTLQSSVNLPANLNCVACGVTANIGAGGGSITSADGALTIVVPPGALDSDTELSIEGLALANLPDEFGDVKIGKAYELGPDGQMFITPVTLSWMTGEDTIGPGGELGGSAAALVTTDGGVLEAAGDIEVVIDQSIGEAVVTGTLDHFTPVLAVTLEAARFELDGFGSGEFDVGADIDLTLRARVAVDFSDAQTEALTITATDASAAEIEGPSDPVLLNIPLPGSRAATDPRIGFYPDTYEEELAYLCLEAIAFSQIQIILLMNQGMMGTLALAQSAQLGNPLVALLRQTQINLVTIYAVVCIGELLPRLLGLPVGSPEGATLVRTPFANLLLPFRRGAALAQPTTDIVVSVGAQDGSALIDPFTGELLVDFTDDPNVSQFGAVPLIDPVGDSDYLIEFGPSGYVGRVYVPDDMMFGPFVQIDINQSNWTDGVPYGGDPAGGGAVLTNNSFGELATWDYHAGYASFIGPTRLVNPGQFNSLGASPVSAWRETDDGPVLGVAESFGNSAGVLFFHSGTNADEAPISKGDLPAGPRRIRCSLPICATSHFADDKIGIVTWDGADAVTIVDTPTVGDGPVGIDIAPSSGGFAVVSTGFIDNSYTVTEVNAAGVVQSNMTMAVPDGCVNPGHAAWLGDANGTAFITCFSSGNAALIPNALP